MHFITFPVASTNIFPLSNSKQGGQLVTEFNLKARDMVATNPNVKYPIGPSFIHCADDFKVKLLEATDVPDYDKTKLYDRGDYCVYKNDTYICIKDITSYVDPEDPNLHTDPTNTKYWTKTSISTSILQIGPGRAVINGHYVETLAPMQIDLNLANAELKQQAQPELYGNLSIGIKSYFSTENTMAGSMLIENTDNMYVGIQLVVTKREDFKTPEDCPELDQQSEVTADIKLADFTYINGVISASSIAHNPNAMRYIPSERIRDFSALLDDKYVSAENMVDRMFYTYSGLSGWCDSTESLMVWDKAPEQSRVYIDPETETFVTVGESQFVIDNLGNVHLVVPHKQQDGEIYDNAGKRMYYADKIIPFPTASFAKNTSGIVTKEYTQVIKDIQDKMRTYKQFTNGKQIAYWDTLTMDSDGQYSHEFPKNLESKGYNIGDYILVREDYTVSASEDEGAAPATMYVILPGMATGVAYFDEVGTPPGLLLSAPEVVYAGDADIRDDQRDALAHLADFYSETKEYHVDNYAAYSGKTYKCIQDTQGEWDESCWLEILSDDATTMFAYNTIRGIAGKDYFEVDFHNTEDNEVTPYYYTISTTQPNGWSEAILLTGGVPLATEDQVGGFYNATTDTEYADAGYVYLDDTGHLKLVDYELLRSGALAYQLGEDFSVPSNQTLDAIQEYLDETVNARVAFKTKAELTSTPTMINVYIPLPADETGVLNIYNLDSRFGTGVYLHFLMEDKTRDYSNIIINITDCEKVRIDSSVSTVSNGPLINIFRTCLYYDAQVINYITLCDTYNQRPTLFSGISGFTGFDNLTLWYARFLSSDPDLIVNGMEISQPNVGMTTQEVSFWDEIITGDNHYAYALRSITLSGSGKLIACSMYVANTSTEDDVVDATTKHIIIGGDFILPQGRALNYPMACVTSPIQITGTFTTAYQDDTKTKWIVTDTSFTAKSGTYSPSSGMANGSIAFNSTTDLIDATYTHGINSIDGWKPGEYHIFYGGTTV
jgi:hypothetical protein